MSTLASGMLSDRTKQRMIDRLIQHGIKHPKVLKAMAQVPRHFFVDEALATMAYDDKSLPIGYGQTISQPYTVARMTEMLFTPNMPRKVLEIGTGCGYQSAILLASGVTEVYSIERLATMLHLAKQNLRRARLTTVRLVHQDGHEGLPEVAPFDGILITAAIKNISNALLDQLSNNGRLIAPIGEATQQYLWCFEKSGQTIQKTCVEMVNFVPMIAGKA